MTSFAWLIIFIIYNFIFTKILQNPFSNWALFVFFPLFTDHKLLLNVIKYTKIKREKSRRTKDQIFVNGFRFVIASQSDSTIYLKCANFRNKCNARASKRKDTGQTFITKSSHTANCECMLDPILPMIDDSEGLKYEQNADNLK